VRRHSSASGALRPVILLSTQRRCERDIGQQKASRFLQSTFLVRLLLPLHWFLFLVVRQDMRSTKQREMHSYRSSEQSSGAIWTQEQQTFSRSTHSL